MNEKGEREGVGLVGCGGGQGNGNERIGGREENSPEHAGEDLDFRMAQKFFQHRLRNLRLARVIQLCGNLIEDGGLAAGLIAHSGSIEHRNDCKDASHSEKRGIEPFQHACGGRQSGNGCGMRAWHTAGRSQVTEIDFFCFAEGDQHLDALGGAPGPKGGPEDDVGRETERGVNLTDVHSRRNCEEKKEKINRRF